VAVQVLIVDDSSFFRNRLADIISSDPELNVIATADNGHQAVKLAAELKPDIITMDIEMPEMDGITATRHIMSNSPTAILMLSSNTTSGATATLNGLEAGALDYMPKRFEDVSLQQKTSHQKLCKKLLKLAKNYHSRSMTNDKATRYPIKTNPVPLELIVIGTSTGGPIALHHILSTLPPTFPVPIVVIQHMPAAFTPSFAERLNTQCAINVKEAQQDDILSTGTAYIAPGGKQTRLRKIGKSLSLSISASDDKATYQPCVDTTLESVSAICPKETLVIILTGMGSDGKKGCENLKQFGATVWSQDEQSSTIYGMPMAIAKAGLADKVLSLDNISQQLLEIVN